MCYEWRAAEMGAEILDSSETSVDKKRSDEGEGSNAPAPLGQLESLFAFLEESLWTSGFFGGNRGVNSAYGPEDGSFQEDARASAAMSRLRRFCDCART